MRIDEPMQARRLADGLDPAARDEADERDDGEDEGGIASTSPSSPPRSCSGSFPHMLLAFVETVNGAISCRGALMPISERRQFYHDESSNRKADLSVDKYGTK